VGPTTIVGPLTLTATCPANTRVIGGGFSSTSAEVVVFQARIGTPGLGGTYVVSADDGLNVGNSLTAFAYCAP
jgi:hypothetical protein